MSLGLLACMVCWIPTWDIHLAAVPIGALGIVIGLLGFLGAILFRRNGSGLPISGMIVCALAMGIGIEQPILAKFLKGIESAPNTTPTNGSSRAPSNTPILPTPRPSSPGQTGNALVTPAIVAPAPQPTATADAIAAAKAEFASAQAKLDADLAGNSAYQTAKTNADAARTNVQNVRATASAGSTELALASQQWIDATNALSEALKAAQATNPAIDADAKAVQKAQAALDALQSPHPPARATPAAQGR
jgi:hypothetical protein